MSFYPKKSHKTAALLKNAFFYYGKAFKAAWFYILLAVLSYHINEIPHYFFVGKSSLITINFIAVFISLYFWSAALYAIHRSLKNDRVGLAECLLTTLQRYHRVVLVAILYLAVFVGMLFWLRIVNGFVGYSQSAAMMRWWLSLFLVGFPLLLFMLLFLLSVPLIIMENNHFFSALGKSAKMVWLSIFKATLVLYAGMIILVYLVWPYTRHTQWASDWHISIIFDAVLLLILAPIVMNYALFLANSLIIFIAQRPRAPSRKS